MSAATPGSGASELAAVRASPLLRYLFTASNDHNDIHHFAVAETPLRVMLHEGDGGKLFAVWMNPERRSSREGPYVRLEEVFSSLPLEVRAELCRLRPLLSRRHTADGTEQDGLAEVCPGES